jgi:hypothetical protein
LRSRRRLGRPKRWIRRTGRRLSARLDADGDGWISVEEAAAHPEVAANFQKADRDHDGRLSLEEFEAVALNRSDQPGKFRNPDRG